MAAIKCQIDLGEHLGISHLMATRQYNCSICAYTSNKLDRTKQHVQVHSLGAYYESSVLRKIGKYKMWLAQAQAHAHEQ